MPYILSALSGLLLFFSFPPFDLGYLAWIALVPIFIAFEKTKRTQGFGLAFFSGLIFFCGSVFWVRVFHPLALPFSIIYLSLYFGLFGYIACTGSPRPYYLAMIWTSVEYLKSLGYLGFPWFSLGYTQHKFLSFIQISQFTGVWGVTFLIILFNAGLAQCFIKKRLDKLFVSTVIIICLILLWGNYVTKKISQNYSKSELDVAVIQGNFDVWTNFPSDVVLSQIVPLSMQAVKQNKVDLVIWTETVILEDIEKNEVLKNNLLKLVKDMDCCLLLGAPSYQKTGNEENHFNSAVLISPDGSISYYNKNHLVPFGELVPGNKKYGLMKKIAEFIQSGEYDSDSELRLLDMSKAKFGTMICFEGIFGNIAGNFVKQGANFLVNITEDDWLKNTPGMRQHAYMSVFRAVENQIYYVRAGNSGLSFIADPTGKIIQSMPIQTQGFFVGKIYLKNDAKTFYTKYGDVFVWIVLLFSVIMLLSKIIKSETKNSWGAAYNNNAPNC